MYNGYVYIIEFKLNKSAEEALAQIHENKYYEKYTRSGKIIHLIGANFSTETRNVDALKAQKFNGITGLFGDVWEKFDIEEIDELRHFMVIRERNILWKQK